MIICDWWLTSVFQSSCCLCNLNVFSYHISFLSWPSSKLHLWVIKVTLIGSIKNKILLRLHMSLHKVCHDSQNKSFRLWLFFRCGLVISNSSDCSTGLGLLREVLYLLFPSYSLWGCRTSRGGDCDEYLQNCSPDSSPAEQWPGLLGSRSIATRCFAEAAGASLEYIEPLQNLVLSQHGFFAAGNVDVLHVKAGRWHCRQCVLGP